MALDEELFEWALTRPWWQQQALARLAEGQTLDTSDHESIAAALLGPAPQPPEGGWLGSALRPITQGGRPVRLVAVHDVSNVNALVLDQSLTFAVNGLTVVYGDNGSGKSGYARVLKRSVRARHREDLLPDIFRPLQGSTAAMIDYVVGDEFRTGGLADESPALSQVAFYDEKCGDCYVSMEAEVTYRPSGLYLLDALIGVCDGVRDALDRRIAANRGATLALPLLLEPTESASFVASLDGSTPDQAINAACTFTQDDAEVFEQAQTEENRLRSSDPAREKAHSARVAAALDGVAAALGRLDGVVNAAAEGRLRELAATATETRAAAAVASSASFNAEPVAGVGVATWRTLWEAARQFSEGAAYPDQTFPVTDDGARCPLCQQALDADASDRLHRFHVFMSDDTETRARDAEEALREAVTAVRAAVTITPTLAVHLESVRIAEPNLAARADEVLEVLEERRAALAALPDDVAAPSALDAAALVESLTARADALRGEAEHIDATQFTALLDAAVVKRKALEARRALAGVRAAVVKERDRRHERARLDVARRETDTAVITRKSTELTRTYVTANVQDRFSRESDRMGVERVTLQDTRGHKGPLMHRPAFLGASVRAELPHVLSEGEQTALGLAGFFTEAHFDTTASALVLDDPVTSLDHLRRAQVAARIADFARERQVVVFTHDSAFVAELRRYADEEAVTFTERAVERRRRDDAPGVCVESHPWNAKDAKERLGWLRTDLARIRRDESGWDRDTYDREVALWAGALSETWERIVSMEIANQLVDRSKLEVRITMMKVVARISEKDNKELQGSYSRCSKWARRHDKDQALNYVVPKTTELEAELDQAVAWFDRVRKYKNS